MFCTKCGANVDDTAVSCPSCNAPMKQVRPSQPAAAQPSASYSPAPYSPVGPAGTDEFYGMNGSQRMWLTALRVFAKIFFVVSVIAGLWWAYTIGRTPFVDTSGLKAGIVVGFTASGFITAVFLNMAGDILEMKCFMKACGGK